MRFVFRKKRFGRRPFSVESTKTGPPFLAPFLHATARPCRRGTRCGGVSSPTCAPSVWLRKASGAGGEGARFFHQGATLGRSPFAPPPASSAPVPPPVARPHRAPHRPPTWRRGCPWAWAPPPVFPEKFSFRSHPPPSRSLPSPFSLHSPPRPHTTAPEMSEFIAPMNDDVRGGGGVRWVGGANSTSCPRCPPPQVAGILTTHPTLPTGPRDGNFGAAGHPVLQG